MTTTPERSATLSELVAAQIRSLLGYRDIKPSELARQLGENDQWLSVRLKGRVPINLNDMHRIAKVLDVPVGQLMPPPDIAAGATDPRLTARYLSVAVRPAISDRPRDNRPIGRPGGEPLLAGARTGYLDRGRPRRRDR